jgi:cytochrome b6-f complex iron-sulfur subunit
MGADSEAEKHAPPPDVQPRRGFFGRLTASSIMFGGLAAGYGTLAIFAARFMFPKTKASENWQFVAVLDQLQLGLSQLFVTANGAKIVVARQRDGETVDCFAALSSVCPHLGCAVHWEQQNKRFFCPCHNGAFDAAGKATQGPPAAANQSLKEYPLKAENGLLFIAIPNDGIA